MGNSHDHPHGQPGIFGTTDKKKVPAAGLAGVGARSAQKAPAKNVDPKQQLNYLFYTNQTPSRPEGDYIDNIHEEWKFRYQHLEENHGYIQWLFPVFESGGMNWDSDSLSKEEAALFRGDIKICTRFLKSYKLQLNFYGVTLVDFKTGELARNPCNWVGRYNNFVKKSHNNLRISRIIMALGEFGFPHYKEKFVNHWKKEIEENGYLLRCRTSLVDFWEPLLMHDDPRYISKTGEDPADREPNILVKHINDNSPEWQLIEKDLTEYLDPQYYPDSEEGLISDFTFSDNWESNEDLIFEKVEKPSKSKSKSSEPKKTRMVFPVLDPNNHLTDSRKSFEATVDPQADGDDPTDQAKTSTPPHDAGQESSDASSGSNPPLGGVQEEDAAGSCECDTPAVPVPAIKTPTPTNSHPKPRLHKSEGHKNDGQIHNSRDKSPRRAHHSTPHAHHAVKQASPTINKSSDPSHDTPSKKHHSDPHSDHHHKSSEHPHHKSSDHHKSSHSEHHHKSSDSHHHHHHKSSHSDTHHHHTRSHSEHKSTTGTSDPLAPHMNRSSDTHHHKDKSDHHHHKSSHGHHHHHVSSRHSTPGDQSPTHDDHKDSNTRSSDPTNDHHLPKPSDDHHHHHKSAPTTPKSKRRQFLDNPNNPESPKHLSCEEGLSQASRSQDPSSSQESVEGGKDKDTHRSRETKGGVPLSVTSPVRRSGSSKHSKVVNRAGSARSLRPTKDSLDVNLTDSPKRAKSARSPRRRSESKEPRSQPPTPPAAGSD